MKKTMIAIFFVLIINCISCQENNHMLPSILNGAWEDASRDFSGEERVSSKFKAGTAYVIELHSFVFFIATDSGIIYTSDQAFIVTQSESLPRNRVRITCYPQGGSVDKLYTYVFKVLDDTTIEFMRNESSTPLFPSRLKKGGEVYP